MLEVPVYNTSGKKVETLKVDEAIFGGTVNAPLLKQAIVAYLANKRQGSAANKSRGMVSGSTKKLFRQKGTGNARRGSRRANVLRGGGVAFAKKPHSFSKKLPKKMRRAALDSALLAKMIGENLMVVDGLSVSEPKTKQMSELLSALKINRTCLLTLAERDSNVYLSSRNIQDLTVRITEELNAHDVAVRQKMLVTSDAMKQLMDRGAQA